MVGRMDGGHATQHRLVEYSVGRHQAFEFFKPVKGDVDLHCLLLAFLNQDEVLAVE